MPKFDLSIEEITSIEEILHVAEEALRTTFINPNEVNTLGIRQIYRPAVYKVLQKVLHNNRFANWAREEERAEPFTRWLLRYHIGEGASIGFRDFFSERNEISNKARQDGLQVRVQRQEDYLTIRMGAIDAVKWGHFKSVENALDYVKEQFKKPEPDRYTC